MDRPADFDATAFMNSTTNDARLKTRAIKQLPVVPVAYGQRQIPSRVRCFCNWLREAHRWLKYGWGPSYSRSAEPTPAPRWMYFVIAGLLAAEVAIAIYTVSLYR